MSAIPGIRPPFQRLSPLACALACALASPAQAVTLGANGHGQAVIYPYYTVRSSGSGNAFNTYLTLGNSTSDAKALRVHVREGRAGREALSFNLYLGPNDLWTAALVPTADGARLVTTDTSCTDPPLPTQGAGTLAWIDLNNLGFSGAMADGFGSTLDRTREGYVEIIELATLTGAHALAVTHNAAGFPTNCPAIRATDSPTVAAPSGGLWGNLTLINVNSGQDFTLEATALDHLATRPWFRPASDPTADFNAPEIDPVSVVSAGGRIYRSVWSRPVDAVSAALMRDDWISEYVLDTATHSLTDLVVALPTRHHYVTATTFSAPFTTAGAWSGACPADAERIAPSFYNREELSAVAPGCGAGVCPPEPPGPRLCAAVGVASASNGAAHIPALTSRTALLGSETRGFLSDGALFVTVGFQNGWVSMTPFGSGSRLPTMVSLPQSTRFDVATQQSATGPHTFAGLPVIGFAVRSLANGTLVCGSGQSCQGNYGGAFSFKYRRSISAP